MSSPTVVVEVEFTDARVASTWRVTSATGYRERSSASSRTQAIEGAQVCGLRAG
jgi:hypothetical protein